MILTRDMSDQVPLQAASIMRAAKDMFFSRERAPCWRGECSIDTRFVLILLNG